MPVRQIDAMISFVVPWAFLRDHRVNYSVTYVVVQSYCRRPPQQQWRWWMGLVDVSVTRRNLRSSLLCALVVVVADAVVIDVSMSIHRLDIAAAPRTLHWNLADIDLVRCDLPLSPWMDSSQKMMIIQKTVCWVIRQVSTMLMIHFAPILMV